jgi:hypothetical protein
VDAIRSTNGTRHKSAVYRAVSLRFDPAARIPQPRRYTLDLEPLRRKLAWRDRVWLRLYFDEGWLMREIGSEWSVQEATVSLAFKGMYREMREVARCRRNS